LGDWSGDGLADLAIGGETNQILLVSSTGNFTQPSSNRIITSLLITNATMVMPALAQQPGHNLCDLYVLRDDGTVDFYPNTGIATEPFTASTRVANILGTAVPNATGLAVADMNNDGILDVLVSDQTGGISEFLGASNQTYTAHGRGFAGTYTGFANRLTLTVGDLSGNGNPDLVAGFAEGGLIYMFNPAANLLISPPSTTVVAGQTASFSTLNASGSVNWSLLYNNSGGFINPTTGAYQSGQTGGSIDFIKAVDASGLSGRAYVNVIGTNELASFGKAVIVAGGEDLADPVWLDSDYLANMAYNVLLYKGYAKTNIQYLSLEPGQDVEGDGSTNDIAGYSSFANVANTFTNWVGPANRLFVYLVDHGSATPGGAYFRLNSGEDVTSTQLNAWLTAIQNQYNTEVIVVMDFCYSGQFVQDLAYNGPAKRIVIAATSPGELTYFLSGGQISFSDLFFSGILEGLNLDQAFLFGQSGMQGYQDPMMGDNADGIYQTNANGALEEQIQIGATALAGQNVPIIGTVAPSQTLSTSTTADIWANNIQSYYPIQSVFCTIVSPSFMPNTNEGVPVTGISEVTLPLDSSGRYETNLGGFTENGVYKINYYAQDIWGSVSPAQQGLVIQAGYDERMILVTGGTTNDPNWSSYTNLAAAAYTTALARRLDNTHIQYLSVVADQDLDGSGSNDVASLSSLAALGQSITNWAAGANKLTIYMLGSTTTNGLYQLNATDTLSPTQLEEWLNSFQVSNSPVIVVMDFNRSGSYIPALVVSNGAERIDIASTAAGATSVCSDGGLISFSQFFLGGVFIGQSLDTAFDNARAAIGNASGRAHQAPQLDDNGDGIPNEKNVDGLVAAQTYLGTRYFGWGRHLQRLVCDHPAGLWRARRFAADQSDMECGHQPLRSGLYQFHGTGHIYLHLLRRRQHWSVIRPGAIRGDRHRCLRTRQYAGRGHDL
jgi:hypothetical protein